MSIFLHLHEIAAKRGDGLRPELIRALQDTCQQNEVISLAAQRSKAVFETADSPEMEQSGDWKHRTHAK
ncbi:hypothetical protein GA0061102_1004148 [Rhizobium miluonense]|uniref:Uncharacterized protein n=1 Tax=Rhizobium miluonense TaxID=411945 RepID=A0A1C3ULF2_9HYPH|nr:hypothetical protein GA0061102_1004148 [Rhizobium miluonense]